MSWYTAAATLASGVISALAGKSGVDKEVEEQRYLQERANEMDIAKWNMMKDYETPQAQMQRFKDAGLNPDLIYGQQSSAPSMPESPVPNAPNIASAYNAAAGNVSESMLISSQIRKNNADAEQASAGAYKDLSTVEDLFPAMVKQYNSQAGLNEQKTKESEESVKLIQQKVQESLGLVEVYKSQSGLNNSLTSLNDVKLQYADKYYDESVKAIIAKREFDEENKKYLIELTERLKNTHKAYLSMLNAQGRYYSSSADLADSEKELNKQRKEWYDKEVQYPEYKDGKPTGKMLKSTYGELMVEMEAKQYELLNLQIKYMPMQVMMHAMSQVAGVRGQLKQAGVDKSGVYSADNGKLYHQRVAEAASIKDYESFLVEYNNMLVGYIKMCQ